jgi:hypothetical protein
VSYPTWLSSRAVGGIYSQMLLQFETKIGLDSNFDYFLVSLAKMGSVKGLFCYSDPQLVIDKTISVAIKKASFFLIKR